MHSVVIRMGAAHSTMSINGTEYDMSSDFGPTSKESRRNARLALVDSCVDMFGSRKDKRRLRRIRKGFQA